MKRSIFISTFIITLSLSAGASADVLGNINGGWSTDMGAHTYFYNTQFTSSNTGKQNEYYVEYTPNSDAVPVVVNGASIWGTRNIKQAEQYMRERGMRPLAGINADYFSFKTGIPMGYTISEGELISKESGGQDAIGFRADGTGFIRWLDVKTTLSDNERSIDIAYINKWCQPGFEPVYLLTDKFGSNTRTASECIFVICSANEGRLRIGESMNVTVDEVFVYDGSVEIPEGKMVFVMDRKGNADCYDFLSRLSAGEQLTIKNEALGDDGTWSGAENGISTVGGRLVSNGAANTGFEAGVAPRTAVGIKADGTIVFYTLDGRQTGHSYGAQLKTLAQRMVELGCVDAINLDGGGSTTISAHFPGSDSSVIVNSPSDGYARSVANFIFLKDNREPTGEIWIVNLSEAGNTNYLSGMSTKVNIESVYDTSNYKLDAPYNLAFRVDTETESVIDNEGYLYLNGTGDVNVVLYNEDGDVKTQLYSVYETPEEIKLFNQADWKQVTGIYTEANEELQLNLSAASYVNGVELLSNNGLYTWEVEGNVGTITPNGIFTLANTVNEEGKIIVTAGDKKVEIPVKISDYPKTPNPFADTQNHWAQDIISQMAASGIINGLELEGRLVFRPDNNMTRAEFASMIANFMELDTDSYENSLSDFTDASEIPLWAQKPINAVYSEGIILGRVHDDGTTSFSPYDNITRAEAMTILGRILQDPQELLPLTFGDSSDVPKWAKEGVQKVYTLGIVTGYEDNTILPNNNVKRAEAATMLYKIENE